MTIDIFKAFGLRKTKIFRKDVGGGTDMDNKNLGGGDVLPSSEEPEDQHPDEDKKKTPNGGEGDGE